MDRLQVPASVTLIRPTSRLGGGASWNWIFPSLAIVADNSEVRLKLQLLRYGTHVSLNPDKNTVSASISFTILSSPPLPSQPVFDSTSWSCVNPARNARRKMECAACNSEVLYCSKAGQIADWPHDCYTYRGKTVPSVYHLSSSCYCDLLPSKRRRSKVMGLQ